jgi:hypothetical protein
MWYFIKIGYNLLIMLNKVDLNILNFSTHLSSSYSIRKTMINYIVPWFT